MEEPAVEAPGGGRGSQPSEEKYSRSRIGAVALGRDQFWSTIIGPPGSGVCCWATKMASPKDARFGLAAVSAGGVMSALPELFRCVVRPLGSRRGACRIDPVGRATVKMDPSVASAAHLLIRGHGPRVLGAS